MLGGTLVFVQSVGVPPQGAPAQSGRGGVFAPITDVPYGDYADYTSLRDGRTLNGWDGESDVWSIDNGAIHADTTKLPVSITFITKDRTP